MSNYRDRKLTYEQMSGDPRRCFCWDVRVPYIHILDDHKRVRPPAADSRQRGVTT